MYIEVGSSYVDMKFCNDAADDSRRNPCNV
jgi:hypothetical protein